MSRSQAAGAGDAAKAQALEALKVSVNERGVGGTTALHFLAKNGPMADIRIFVSMGADMEAKDDRGQTPLHWAAGMGQLEPMTVLFAVEREQGGEVCEWIDAASPRGRARTGGGDEVAGAFRRGQGGEVC